MEREVHFLGGNGWVPNNPAHPVVIYRSALPEGPDPAERFERLFADHGWPPDWRDTIYDYHHYHSSAHEALGIACGSAKLMLGGPDRLATTVSAGDALLLPAGTGHCRMDASEDFLVVGAYPKGQQWDICRDAPSEEARRRIASLPMPGDPVLGPDGER
ncbi:cupin [Sphingopyxis sp.]|uniref:cupin n=1 Tax=Sphingopyxis sp. TaxID=1908224 RepID=UPI002D77BA36|nr:cupin [Sphingopyxis sp.]HET6526873.1 cupin [Sphingopyxis sp.]